MNINVEKTRQYYKEYKECRCTDCINFYKVFPQMYPKICEYLLSIGIDPTKPLELCSIYNQKEDRMEYLICMYVGIGKVEDDFEIEIEGLEISINRSHHPILETNEEAFVIDFGPVYIKQTNLYNRHLTKEERIKVINNVLIKHDPIGLIKLGSPLDEYMQEAKLIESIMENKDVFQKNSSFIISRIFNDQFGKEVPIKVIKKIKLDILWLFDFEKTKKEYLEYDELKDKISFDENTLSTIFEFHENFKLKFESNYKTYINSKYFGLVEEQDILYMLLEIIRDDKVFIQYKKKRLFRKNFKVVKGQNFNITKYINDNNVEMIFDVNGIIKK